MTVVRGRGLQPDDRTGSPPVAVINETLARQLSGGVDAALGKGLDLWAAKEGQPHERIAVVGIVRDARTVSLRSQPRPTVYLPAAQSAGRLGGVLLASLEVRLHAPAGGARDPGGRGMPPSGVTGDLRRIAREAHPELAIAGVTTLADQVDASLRQERLLASLSGAFGLVAVLLLCVGIYGVVSHWAARRTREIGVRMALGASAAGVRAMVLRQALGMALPGLAVGIPAAFATGRLLRGFLFGLHPLDPGTFALAALVLLTVAAGAAYLPARRASAIDPMTVLRTE